MPERARQRRERAFRVRFQQSLAECFSIHFDRIDFGRIVFDQVRGHERRRNRR
jgi:hypothetical protein